MIFIFSSIAFFIVSIQSILYWTFLWQKNSYRFNFLRNDIQQWQLKEKFQFFLLYIFFFMLGILYIFVIFYDFFTFWYQLLVAIFLVISASFSLKKFLTFTVIKPIFSIKALSISLSTTFIIAVLYTIPLVDIFLWYIFLYLFIPFIVGIIVALLAFPTEIYEDYIISQVRKIMKNKTEIFTIAVIGEKSDKTKILLNNVLEKYYHSVVVYENKALPILQLMKVSAVTPIIFIFSLHDEEEEMQKISQAFHPDVIICTSDEMDKENVQTIFHMLSKKTTVISAKTNKFLNARFKTNNKKIILYGEETFLKRQSKNIFAYNMKEKNKKVSTLVSFDKEKLEIKNVRLSASEFLHMLPAIYIAKKLYITNSRIQACLKMITDERKR